MTPLPPYFHMMPFVFQNFTKWNLEMYLNVDSGRFGSEMVKLPEQKSHVEQKSKSSLDFDFKYECIRRWARHFRRLRSTKCLHGLLCGLKQKLHNINHCLLSFLSNGYCIWTLSYRVYSMELPRFEYSAAHNLCRCGKWGAETMLNKGFDDEVRTRNDVWLCQFSSWERMIVKKVRQHKWQTSTANLPVTCVENSTTTCSQPLI